MGKVLRHERAKVSKEGKIVVNGLRPDADVEVTISEAEGATTDPGKYRGMRYRYDRPFDPVIDLEAWDGSDWEPER